MDEAARAADLQVKIVKAQEAWMTSQELLIEATKEANRLRLAVQGASGNERNAKAREQQHWNELAKLRAQAADVTMEV